jgi:hypothetical protein
MVLWTSAPLLSDPRPVYSEADKFWTVHVGQPGGGTRMVRCRHIVLATSIFGPPVMPVVPGTETFRGEILHASKFYSGADYTGRRVLVVGSGNTAADVCKDLASAGAARVTMLQRSSSCVVLPNALAAIFACQFPPGIDIGLMDFRNASIPWRVRERLILQEREDRIARGEDPDVEPGDKEQMRKLKDTGFLVNNWRGGRGLQFALLERLGGASFPHGEDSQLMFRCRSSHRYWLLRSPHPQRNRPQDVRRTLALHRRSRIFHGRDQPGGRRGHLRVRRLLLSIILILTLLRTGYQPGTVAWSSIFGPDVIKRAGPVWGLNNEGELLGVYRPSGHPAVCPRASLQAREAR